MHNLTQKITTALATGSVVLATMSGPALAGDYEISENGAGSRNRIFANFENRVDVNQENNSNISNDVRVHANTGGNHANFNTDGDVRIRTGDANSFVHISNRANSNYLDFDRHQDNNYKNSNRFDRNRDDNERRHGDYDKNHNNGDYNRNHDEKDHDNGNGHHDDKDGQNDKHLFAHLEGENEVPGQGDVDGHGHTELKLHPKKGEVCVKLDVENIETPTAAHIHIGGEEVAGPVVVGLPTPTDGYAEGCVTLDGDKIREIKDNPSGFYVNVHNNEYPDGAIRGQLNHNL